MEIVSSLIAIRETFFLHKHFVPIDPVIPLTTILPDYSQNHFEIISTYM